MKTQTTLTILFPCLNEAETIAFCVEEAKQFIEKSQIRAEILVVDNGSVDDSGQIAARLGDCDGSYDFYQINPIIQKLMEGYALVVGNRFNRTMKKGAMPFLHRYIGVPLLSGLARWRFGIEEVYDFHCGLRGFVKEEAMKLNFCTGGMEFATEMIVAFSESGAKICEVPVSLRPDKRSGPSHLRTFRDGWRHLSYILSRRDKKKQP